MAASFAFRFSTKYLDSETALYYYGYRYYDPQNGRWLSRDPIGEQGGMNLRNFVLNRAIEDIDPLGLAPGPQSWWNPLYAAEQGAQKTWTAGKRTARTGWTAGKWTAGTVWNSPNTAIGLVVAIPFYVGHGGPFGPMDIDLNHGAIEFHGMDLPMLGGGITFGQIHIYDGACPTRKVPTYDLQERHRAWEEKDLKWQEDALLHFLRGLLGRNQGPLRPRAAKPASFPGDVVVIGQHEQAHTLQSMVWGPFFLPAYFLNGGISADNPMEKAADGYAFTGTGWWPR